MSDAASSICESCGKIFTQPLPEFRFAGEKLRDCPDCIFNNDRARDLELANKKSIHRLKMAFLRRCPPRYAEFNPDRCLIACEQQRVIIDWKGWEKGNSLGLEGRRASGNEE
jgi:hypothetical protein